MPTYHYLVCLSRNVGLLGGVSDYEELVEVLTGDDGVGIMKIATKVNGKVVLWMLYTLRTIQTTFSGSHVCSGTFACTLQSINKNIIKMTFS